MKFINKTDKELITKAIVIAEAHLTPDSYIMNLVANKNDWKYGTNMPGKEVVVKLCAIPKEPVKVYTYKSRIPWSAAIAYSDGRAIHFNIRRLSNDPHIVAATLLHELSHIRGFSHGNNFPSKDKNLFSVNYFISSNL